jgi:hypothetical protein
VAPTVSHSLEGAVPVVLLSFKALGKAKGAPSALRPAGGDVDAGKRAPTRRALGSRLDGLFGAVGRSTEVCVVRAFRTRGRVCSSYQPFEAMTNDEVLCEIGEQKELEKVPRFCAPALLLAATGTG